MYADVERLYRTTIDRNPDCWMAQQPGRRLVQRGQINEAIGQYRQALQIKPDYTEAYNNLGAALAGCGGSTKRSGSTGRALQIKPGVRRGPQQPGPALARRGRIDEAIAHLQKGRGNQARLRRGPQQPRPALDGRGQIDEAIAHYQRALEIKPDYAEAHNNLGARFGSRRTD